MALTLLGKVRIDETCQNMYNEQLNAVTIGGGATSRTPLSSSALMAAVVNRMQQPSYSESEGRQMARHIDQLSRRLFPAAFLAFNVIYWTVYAAVENPV